MASASGKKPSWLKISLPSGSQFTHIKQTLRKYDLHTVCEEARCPNIYECWERGTATIMILGDICTRECGFCSVKTGLPNKLDKMEPIRTAMAVKKMALNHVVITSVDRDDLKGDYGAEIWAETIKQIKKYVPKCTVEVLTPDFKGYRPALEIVFNANPDIFSHNIECIERISRKVRAQAVWKRSLDVLKQSVDFGLRTKTGMMVGLGESKDDVIDVMSEIVDLGVEIFTIGQYLQPTKDHLSVERYVDDKEFQYYKQRGLELGFKVVESGSLVRSSYHADEQARLVSEKV